MSQSRICLIHPNPGPECETFIRAQTTLPGVVSVLHGGHMPLYDQDGGLLHPDLPEDAPLLFSPDGLVHTAEQEQAAQSMADYLVANKIDVVLAEYGPTGVVMVEPCKRAEVPLVTHFHGFDASMKAALEKYAAGYERLFKEAATIVAVSKVMERDLLNLGAPEDRLIINPYGVDATLFDSGKPEEAEPHFIAVGRFVGKKSPLSVVRAFAEVVRDVPEARLSMIGDGPLRQACIDLADELNISDSANFPGPQPHAEVAAAMRGARCFVQHSVTPDSGDKEGTPNSVLEASASGLPVVSTIHAGIPEAVVHGETGLLCEEGDEATMAQNMLTMAKAPELAGKYGVAGRNHVMAHYDYATQLNKLGAILKGAANG